MKILGIKVHKVIIGVGIVPGLLVGVEVPDTSNGFAVDVYVGIIRIHFSVGVFA